MRGQRLSAAVSVLLAFAVMLCAVLLFAACGGGPPAAVARLASSSPATAGASAGESGQQQGIAHSQCMRAHGVPGFPDPSPQGYVQLGSGDGINPNSSQFQAALAICAKLDPVGGQGTQSHFDQDMTDALKFAACMRAHGIADFPDPVPYGNGGVQLLVPKGIGVNVNSPQFAAATRICQPLWNG
jgi:hypothetical protein